MHNLYCLPLGESMRGEFTARLIEALAAGKGHEQALLLPSSYMINDVRQMIRDSGLAGYEPPGLLAFDDLVAELAGSAGNRYRLMDRLTQELLVEEVVSKLNGIGELPYFSAVSSFPGFIGTITSLLAEIKGSGTTPAEFAQIAKARDNQPKDLEIYKIYVTYQSFLQELQLADLEESYYLAFDALERGKTAVAYKHLYISEFYILTPLQIKLVKYLRRILTIDIGLIYEKDRPGLYAAVEPTCDALLGLGFTPVLRQGRRGGAHTLAHIRNNLYQEGAPTLALTSGLEIISCADRRQEMAVAAGKIKKLLLEETVRPQDVAVVVRDTGLYEDFRQVCAEFGLPLSMPWDVALADQPLAKLLVAVMTARLENGSRASVINLIKSPLLSGLIEDADDLERRALDAHIRNWRDWRQVIGRDDPGRGGFIKLRRLVAALPQRGRCQDYVTSLHDFISRINITGQLGQDYRAGKITLPLLKAGLIAFEKIAGPDGILNQLARGFFYLAKSESIDLSEFLYYFHKEIAGQTIRLATAPQDGIRLVSPLGVRGTDFPSVFLLGLTEGQFPARNRENWLYNDQERAALNDLGLDIMTAAFRRREEDLYFAVAVALAGRQLTLSCMEDAETMPSPYLDEITRLFSPNAVHVEKHPVNELFPANYENIYSGHALAGRSLPDGFDPAVSTVAQYIAESITDSDFIRRATLAANTRSGGEMIGCALPEKPANTFSITALEDYAQCPFQYFVKRVLKVDEWSEKDEEAGPDIIGSIYHEVLARFLRSYAGQTLKAEKYAEYSDELILTARAVFTRLAGEGSIVEGKRWDFQMRKLEDVLLAWLEYEIAEQNGSDLQLRPRFFEWGFGLPAGEGMDPASVAAPLPIEVDGQVINIVGKVDRVDLAGDKAVVIDYKRKSCPKFSAIGEGLDLQAALYIMAVEKLLCPAGVVVGGGYYSIEGRKKEGGMWRAEFAADIAHRSAKREGNLTIPEWDELQQQVKLQVGRCVAGIRAGFFPASPAADCPPYCLGREICRYVKSDAAGEQTGGEADG